MCGLKILPGSSFDRKLRMHSVERNTVGFGSHRLTVCVGIEISVLFLSLSLEEI